MAIRLLGEDLEELAVETAEDRRICQQAIEAATPAHQPTLSVEKLEVPFTLQRAASSVIKKGLADIALGEVYQEAGISPDDADDLLTELYGNAANAKDFLPFSPEGQ